jgi:hypothetical protein
MADSGLFAMAGYLVNDGVCVLEHQRDAEGSNSEMDAKMPMCELAEMLAEHVSSEGSVDTRPKSHMEAMGGVNAEETTRKKDLCRADKDEKFKEVVREEGGRGRGNEVVGESFLGRLVKH